MADSKLDEVKTDGIESPSDSWSPDSEGSPVDGNTAAPKRGGIGERPEIFKTTLQEILFVTVATMAVGITSFFIGAITVLSTFVGRSLDMTTSEIAWISAACGLATGTFLLFFGRLADFFGRKTITVVAIGCFSILCIGASFSPSGIVLDTLSGLIGVSSAAAVPASLGILGSAYKPSKRKNYAFACFSAGNPIGFVLGAIISGILTQLVDWRAAFWAIAVIYALVTIFAFFSVPKDTEEKKSLSRKTVKEFDVVGVLLTIAGIAMFSAGLTQGSEAGWTTPYVLVLIIVGFFLIVAFVFWELRYPFPIIPMTIWKDINFSLLIVIIGLGFLTFPPALFWIALYFQWVMNLEPLMVAVHLLPAAISGLLVNIIAAMILHKVSNKLLMGIGAMAYTIAFILLAVQREGDSYWAFAFPGLTLVVIGADFQFNVCNMYIMSSRPKSEQSLAGGILQTITRLATTVGFGIATAVFDTIKRNPPTTGYYANNAAAPYSAVFWFCAVATGISVFMVPFLTLSTQGNQQSSNEDGQVGQNKK